MRLLKIKDTIIFFAIVNSLSGYCQTYFNNTYGHPYPNYDGACCQAIEVAGEGYLFPFKSIDRPNGDSKIILQKINYKGDTLWKKVFGKVGVQLEPYYIIKSKDGNYLISGSYYKLADSTMCFYLLKVNQNGDSIWSKKYPPVAKALIVYSTMVKQTGDGGYVLCGARQPCDTKGNPLAADIFVVKTDTMGNMQWSNTYGGPLHDGASSIIQTADKGFLMGGFKTHVGLEDKDFYILKIDSTGKLEWDKFYGTAYSEVSSGMIQLKDGNYLLIGELYSVYMGVSKLQALIIKIKPDGTVIWEKKYGGVKFSALMSVVELFSGDIVVAGYTNNTPSENPAGWLVKINKNGDFVWERIYAHVQGYVNYFYGIIHTNDKGFVLTGSAQISDSLIFYNHTNAWVLKLDSMGCDIGGCLFVGNIGHKSNGGSINFFPNPSIGIFTVTGEMLLKKCVVMDVLGNILYMKDNIQSLSIDVSLPQLSNGIYFLEVIFMNDKEEVRKVIIEH